MYIEYKFPLSLHLREVTKNMFFVDNLLVTQGGNIPLFKKEVNLFTEKGFEKNNSFFEKNWLAD